MTKSESDSKSTKNSHCPCSRFK